MTEDNTIGGGTLTINTARRHVVRFWLTISSTITLISILKSFDDDADLDEQNRPTRWSTSAVSIILIFSFICTAAPFCTELFSGTGMELVMSFLTCAMSASSLPAIMHPSNGLAIKASGALNANLYFFSWATFLLSFFILGDFVNEMRGVPVLSSQWFPIRWVALSITSLVTMFVAGGIFDDNNCSNDKLSGSSFCNRTILAITVGGVSGFICAAWMLISFCLSSETKTTVCDVIVTVFLAIGWCLSIGFITFGNNAPGSNVGNLYFFSWSSFLLSVYLAMIAVVEKIRDSRNSAASVSESKDEEGQETDVGEDTDE